MITYKKRKFPTKKGPNAGKWYAVPVVTETYDLQRLANHMANHNTPFSEGVIKGVLSEMVACIKELLLDGKSVKIDDLAIFTVRLRTRLAPTPEEFKAATHIVGVRMASRSTGNLSTTTIKLEAMLRELGQYTLPETPGGGNTGGNTGGNGGTGGNTGGETGGNTGTEGGGGGETPPIGG